jgi:hypothetical protein
LTNVIEDGLFALERKNMAADGDMFAQRKVWGYKAALNRHLIAA